MTATGWKGTQTYGVRVGSANAVKYFDKRWTSVELEIDGQRHVFPLNETFWTTSPEFRGGPIKTWLLRKGLAPWPPYQPPKLVLDSIGRRRFRLSRDSKAKSKNFRLS
jgi:hypothetical protein